MRFGQQVLLDVQLVGIQEDRRRAGHRPTRPQAKTSEEDIDEEPTGQAHDVLNDRNGEQVVDGQKGPEKERVEDRMDRIGPQMTCVRQIGIRIAVEEESRTIGHRHDDSKDRSDREDDREDPHHDA